MSCLQYSIQSLLPSVLGFPSNAQVLQCSNYGSTGGPTGPNGLRSQFSTTVVPASEVSASPWLNHLNGVMNGSNSVVLRQIPLEDQAQQNMGLSFLPWNRRPLDRATWGTNGQNGTVYPFNPWNQQTVFENGTTLVKVAAMTAGAYYGSKLAYDLYLRS